MRSAAISSMTNRATINANKADAWLCRLEFYRHALALMPEPEDPAPGIAFAVKDPTGKATRITCNCGRDRQKTCAHRRQLEALIQVAGMTANPFALDAAFRGSLWYGLGQVLAEACRVSPGNVRWSRSAQGQRPDLRVEDTGGNPLLIYHGAGPDRARFVERCIDAAPEGRIPGRGQILTQLGLLTLTDQERLLMEKGIKTRRQVFEGTFWFRFAYHGFCEFGLDGSAFSPMIEESSGTFWLDGLDGEDKPVFSILVPRDKVKRTLAAVRDHAVKVNGLPLQPLPVDLIFDARLNAALDLELRPLLKLIRRDGEARFFQRNDLKRFQYGDLYYIPELKLLVEDKGPAEIPESLKLTPSLVKASQVPAFIQANQRLWQSGRFVLDEETAQMQILTRVDRVEIVPEAIDHNWLWLAVTYGMGNQAIRLADLLRAKKAGQRYIATTGGWIDTQSPDLDLLDELALQIADEQLEQDQGRLRLRRQDVYRLGLADGSAPSVGGQGPGVRAVQDLLALRSPAPLPEKREMISGLRAYQRIGTQWLSFLYQNRLGGLLCDEMGLGKTHQVMALMVWLKESGPARAPFLVVCPTTVISHWEKKLAAHAPELSVGVHHGGQRHQVDPFAGRDVVLTSYAILRLDGAVLGQRRFGMVVFDEIQYVKNRQTQTFGAAAALSADIKLGLTGTPVENSLDDLKALMDLVLPGYLGTDERFSAVYRIPIEERADARSKARLNQLIQPFALRRLKAAVLDELPPKIEDVMTCRLSEDQVRLYRDAIKGRAPGLIQVLDDPQAKIPYIHIFALLTLLKRICDHPALVVQDREKDLASGKWDLFAELLDQCLESGQKVVVFSQYLEMLAIIRRHLESLRVGHVLLTGASRNRGDIVARFNEDQHCRVFLGSLKAGGTGIDLVAATVVIHYDRWWNAAREDQATDRVHRIGQKKSVQVFKLVTEGTLEEKIGAIIDKKRLLMEAAVRPDDPKILKSFTREELIELLRFSRS